MMLPVLLKLFPSGVAVWWEYYCHVLWCVSHLYCQRWQVGSLTLMVLGVFTFGELANECGAGLDLLFCSLSRFEKVREKELTTQITHKSLLPL